MTSDRDRLNCCTTLKTSLIHCLVTETVNPAASHQGLGNQLYLGLPPFHIHTKPALTIIEYVVIHILCKPVVQSTSSSVQYLEVSCLALSCREQIWRVLHLFRVIGVTADLSSLTCVAWIMTLSWQHIAIYFPIGIIVING